MHLLPLETGRPAKDELGEIDAVIYHKGARRLAPQDRAPNKLVHQLRAMGLVLAAGRVERRVAGHRRTSWRDGLATS